MSELAVVEGGVVGPEDRTAMMTCSRCGESKPADTGHFHRSKGGLTPACKDCRNAAQRKRMEDPERRAMKRARDRERDSSDEGRRKANERCRRYRERNREKINAASRERYGKDPQNHYRAVRASLQKRLERDPDWQRERMRRYYEENRERMIAAALEYERAHPEVKNTSRNKRRAAEGSHTTAEWLALCAMYGHRCVACGVEGGPLTRDHVVPLSRGGTNDIGNIQPLCASCNSKKHTKTIDYRKEAA